MTPGTRVRMSESLKSGLIANGCAEHVAEFGDCVGVVIGPFDDGLAGPDVDVRWEPSGLRYGYQIELLEAETQKP